MPGRHYFLPFVAFVLITLICSRLFAWPLQKKKLPTRAANKKQTFTLGLCNPKWNAVGIKVTWKRRSLKPLYTSSCPEVELNSYLARWEEPCRSCWVALFLMQLATSHITANKRSLPHNAQEHQTFKPLFHFLHGCSFYYLYKAPSF